MIRDGRAFPLCREGPNKDDDVVRSISADKKLSSFPFSMRVPKPQQVVRSLSRVMRMSRARALRLGNPAKAVGLSVGQWA